MNREERFAHIAQMRFNTLDLGEKNHRLRFIPAIREIYQHRSMLGLLVRRDLKSKYKDSALGFVWTLIRPITQLAIYAIVIGKFLGAERGIPLFAVYIFTGLTLYTLFQEILTGGTGSILANASLVKKIYVPRELFPLASVGTALFNFGIQLVVLLVASALFGNLMISADVLYAIPAIMIVVTYGLALAFLFSATNVFLRDISYIVEILSMILMWSSPILYSWSMVRDTLGAAGLEWLVTVYTWNPLTLAVMAFQRAIYHNNIHGLATPEDLGAKLGIVLVIGLILLWLCHRVFRKVQGNFAQEL